MLHPVRPQREMALPNLQGQQWWDFTFSPRPREGKGFVQGPRTPGTQPRASEEAVSMRSVGSRVQTRLDSLPCLTGGGSYLFLPLLLVQSQNF